ncbi:Pol protein [Phytophthora palmivora]|uniref:Pol protein n=1 Tax=Phytophthora palmivora TaxID=4796 RepID=A0A2P4YUE3_9STRA|nr:Pol protein [Phytophthora palmivora]
MDEETLGELVLLDTKNLPLKVVSSVESNMMKHHFIRPFAVLARHGAAYTIDLPKSMATHPTLYVERLMRYHDPLGPSPWTEEDQVRARLFESRLSPLDNRSSRAGACEWKSGWNPRDSYEGYEDTHGKSSGKNYTHKSSGMSTPAAHKRASDHAPHGLERLSLNEVSPGRKPEHGGQHAVELSRS